MTKDNVLVITSGSFAEKVIETIKNQPRKKVQKIIVFCQKIDYHQKWKD